MIVANTAIGGTEVNLLRNLFIDLVLQRLDKCLLGDGADGKCCRQPSLSQRLDRLWVDGNGSRGLQLLDRVRNLFVHIDRNPCEGPWDVEGLPGPTYDGRRTKRADFP